MKKGKKRTFDLSGLDDEEGAVPRNENEGFTIEAHPTDDYTPLDGDDAPLIDSSFDTGANDEHIEQSIEQDEETSYPEPGSLVEAASMFESDFRSSRHRASHDSTIDSGVAEIDPSPTPEIIVPQKKRKGGRKKAVQSSINEPDHLRSSEQNNKKGKKRNKTRSEDESFEREISIRPKPLKSKSKLSSSRAGSVGPSTARTYQVQRSETPATDDGVYQTRSGRTSYKPLAGWRGEKAVFGRRSDRDTPAPLTDIIRTDEIPMPPPPIRRKTARVPRTHKKLEEIDEVPEEEYEPWEAEIGIKYGLVMSWDQEAQKYDEERDEETGRLRFHANQFLIYADAEKLTRTCIRCRCNRVERHRWRRLQTRKDPHAEFLRLRFSPSSA